jgi:hypothetical protein
MAQPGVTTRSPALHGSLGNTEQAQHGSACAAHRDRPSRHGGAKPGSVMPSSSRLSKAGMARRAKRRAQDQGPAPKFNQGDCALYL